MTDDVMACPECDSVQIHTRSRTGDYWCEEYRAAFETGVERLNGLARKLDDMDPDEVSG